MWRKFAYSASNVIMLRNNRNSRLQEQVFIYCRNKARYVNKKAANLGFCEKMEITRVPPGRHSRINSGTRTTVWERLVYRNLQIAASTLVKTTLLSVVECRE